MSRLAKEGLRKTSPQRLLSASVNPGERPHFGIALTAHLHRFRRCIGLALLAAICDPALEFERLAHVDPGWSFTVTADVAELASLGDTVGCAFS